jgi:hypothetical protein
MRTVAGTLATEPLTDRLTVTGFPAGACEMVTVPVLGEPPKTVVGLSVKPVTVKGVRVSVVFLLVPIKLAVIVTVCDVVTAAVVTTNVAVVAPDGTVTDDGTDAAEALELVSVMTSPAVAPIPPRVTVPVTLV